MIEIDKTFVIISALQDEEERVRGWFPRQCVKIPDLHFYHRHRNAEDHTSQPVIKELDQGAKSEDSLKGQSAKSENSLKGEDVCVKHKPTSGTASQAKKDSLKRSRDKSKTSHTKEGVANRFVNDMKECAAELMKDPKSKATGKAAFYGLSMSVPDRSIISEIATEYIDMLYKTAPTK